MLTEISCNKFREETIYFHSGLNVILGDELATNSIGKSILLLVIDFAFGGSSLFDKEPELKKHLGDHYYLFTFKFNNISYRFKRSITDKNIIYHCNDNYEQVKAWAVEDYINFLKKNYNMNSLFGSFRSLVGLYARIWGKDNLDPKKPLHYFPGQNPKEAIDNLIKLFELYDFIAEINSQLDVLKEKRKSLLSASKSDFVTKIQKTEYKKNQELLSSLDHQLLDLTTNIQRYICNPELLINDRLVVLKKQKSDLLNKKLIIDNKINRLSNNFVNRKGFNKIHLDKLFDFFPNANKEKFIEIENFHLGISEILNKNIKQSIKFNEELLVDLEGEISEIDESIDGLLSKETPLSKKLINHITDITLSKSAAERNNEYFEKEQKSKQDIKNTSEKLDIKLASIQYEISLQINTKLRELVTQCYTQEKKCPKLELDTYKYSYEIIDDSGAGTAYSNLVFFDLSVFLTTRLPFLIHDSILFQQTETRAVSKMISIYNSVEKQSFISIDSINRYSEEAAIILNSKKSIQLSKDNCLYLVNWKEEKPS